MTTASSRTRTVINVAIAVALAISIIAGAAFRVVTSRNLLADVKMLLMTSVYPDTPAGHADLEAKYRALSRSDRGSADYLHYLDPDVVAGAQWAVDAHDDPALVRYLVGRLSPNRPLRGCGDVDGLAALVAAASASHGCCSDLSKVLMAYGLALGVRVRETHNLEHTTVEYFDRARSRWVWIDPTLRAEAVDDDGQPLDQRGLRDRLLRGDNVNFRGIDGTARPDLQLHAGYRASAYRLISWTTGRDLATEDDYDARLRRWHLAKPGRQLIEYLVGVLPGYVGLASPGLALAVTAARAIAWAVGALMAALGIVAVFKVLRRGVRYWRRRRARFASAHEF